MINAENGEKAAAAKDQSAQVSAVASVTSAQNALQSTVAGNAAKAAPPQSGVLAAAETGVQSAQLAVQNAELAVSQTRLVAPADGVVASVSGKVGETVGGGGASASSSSGASGGASGASSGTGAAASSSSSSSSTSGGFIVLTNLHGLQVAAGFSETDAVKVRVGQSAIVTVNALPTQKLAAHVLSVDVTPTTTGGVVTYNVTFALDQTVSGLKPGMTATVQAIVAQTDGAVSLPPAAVTRSGGTPSVLVVRAGKRVAVPVATGVTGDSSIQILTGVNPGDQVAIVSTVTAASVGSGAAAAGAGTGRAGAAGLGGLGGGGGGGAAGAAPSRGADDDRPAPDAARADGDERSQSGARRRRASETRPAPGGRDRLA